MLARRHFLVEGEGVGHGREKTIHDRYERTDPTRVRLPWLRDQYLCNRKREYRSSLKSDSKNITSLITRHAFLFVLGSFGGWGWVGLFLFLILTEFCVCVCPEMQLRICLP